MAYYSFENGSYEHIKYIIIFRLDKTVLGVKLFGLLKTLCPDLNV